MSKKKCPKCGGIYLEVRRYSDKSRLYIHEQEIKAKPFPSVLVTRACFVGCGSAFAVPDSL